VILRSDTDGAFAGVSIAASDIAPDAEQNRAYYERAVSAAEVLGGDVPGPAERPIRSVLAG
jgi:lipid-binding SYLF domain-containing protein